MSYTLKSSRIMASLTPEKQHPKSSNKMSPCSNAPLPAQRPKIRKLEFLKTFIEESTQEIDTNLKAALYSVTIKEHTCNEAVQTLEKVRRLLRRQTAKSSFLISEVDKELSSQEQKINSLKSHELYLHRQNVKLQDKVKDLEGTLDETFGEDDWMIEMGSQEGTNMGLYSPSCKTQEGFCWKYRMERQMDVPY